MRFICLFLPAVIAANHEVTKNDNTWNKLIVFSKYCLYINLIMILVLLAMGRADIHFEDIKTVKFYGLYIVLGLVLAEVLPKVLAYIRKNFNLKIRRIDK